MRAALVSNKFLLKPLKTSFHILKKPVITAYNKYLNLSSFDSRTKVTKPVSQEWQHFFLK